MFFRGPSMLLAGAPFEIVNSVGDRVLTKSWFDELNKLLQKMWV